ncbi:MAG: glycoside hydrolase family 2 TIM barrel-domain containing protein [Candidatus Omnitrophota bacterium]
MLLEYTEKQKRIAVKIFFCFFIFLVCCDFCFGEQPAERFHIKDSLIFYKEKPFFIKGVCYAITYPRTKNIAQIPAEVFEKDFKMMQQAGINAIRTYEPPPEFLLDLAEKYEIMVIPTIVDLDDAVNYCSQKDLEKFKKTALEIVKRDKGRKCILMWSLWNDMPFQFGANGGNVVPRYSFDQVNSFLKEIFLAVKAEDNKHLITASNMLNAPSYQLGFDFLDVIGINTYLGISDWFDGNFDYNLAQLLVKRLKRINRDYAKPIIITETGYSSFCDGYSPVRALEAQIKLAYEHFAGIFIFQWADCWDKAGDYTTQDKHVEEYWGIVDGFRKPKPGFKMVSELFNRIKPYIYLGKFCPEAAKDFSLTDDKNGVIFEDFEYSSPLEFNRDYGNLWQGNARLTVELNAEDKCSGEKCCRIVFCPDSTNAWMHVQKNFSIAKDICQYKKISFWVKGDGPIVNFSLLLKDADKERWKTNSIFPIGEWRQYVFEIDKLIKDPHDFEHDGVLRGNNRIDCDRIAGIALQVNVVPNFEELGIETVFYIDKIELINEATRQ